MIIEIIVTLLLLVLTGLLSSAEAIFSTANLRFLEESVDQKTRVYRRVHFLSSHYGDTILTILLANLTVKISIAILATMIGNVLFPTDYFYLILIAVFAVILTIIIDMIPKKFVVKNADEMMKVYANPLWLLYQFFKPLRVIALFLSLQTNKLKRLQNVTDEVTDEELQSMVDDIEERGMIDERKGDFIRSAIDFTETTAYEIMTPRVDVFAYNIDDSIEVLIKDPAIFIHSRIPVYQGNIDHVIGILPTKRLLKLMLKNAEIDIPSLLVPALYVPSSNLISSILKEFKSTHQHIAIVKDEYGGTEGIITMEDIIEELVGDIWDETDIPEEEVVETKDGTFIVDGTMNIDDFFETIEYDEENKEDYSTVGGWCIDQLGRFGKVDDQFLFDQRFLITVTAASDFTVDEIRVERIAPQDSQEVNE